MNIWETLEIQCTSDIPAIKKAYASKLKVHHPEDDPIGFQSLKEAYDKAVQYAKYMNRQSPPAYDNHQHQYIQDYSNDIESINPSDGNTESPTPPFSSYKTINTNMPFDWNKANQEFIENMEVLYDNFHERIKLDNWISLLNCDVMWDFENRKRLEPMVYKFLSLHYYLPQNIWKALDQSFNIKESKIQLQFSYNKQFTTHVMKLLKQDIPLNYSFVEQVVNNKFDLYFELKENTYDSLENGDTWTAESSLNKAKLLYESDPDLIRMEGVINLQRGRYDQALVLFNNALSLNSDDLESLYYSAHIFYIEHHLLQALEVLSNIFSVLPNHQKALLLATKCYLELNDPFEAKNLITRALSLKPGDENSKNILHQVNKKLKTKLITKMFLNPWKFNEALSQFLLIQGTPKKVLTKRTIISLVRILTKWLLYGIIIIIVLSLTLAIKFGFLFLIFFLVRMFTKNIKE